MYLPKPIFITLLISIITETSIWPQWKIVTENDVVTTSLFSIRHNSEYKFHKGYYFPEFTLTDTVWEDGYKLSFRHKVPEGMVWKHTWKKNIPCYSDSTYIYQRVYLKNIESYDILLCMDNDTWYQKTFNITYDGYQVPTFTEISDWFDHTGEDKKNTHYPANNAQAQQYHINKMDIIIHPGKASEKCEFVIGGFRIFNRKKVEKEVVHPFFEDMKGRSLLGKVTYNSLSELPGIPVLLSAFPYYCHYGNMEGNQGGFTVKDTDPYFDEPDILYQMVRHAIYKYPFFGISDVQEEDVKHKIGHLANYKDSSRADTLSHIIGLFHDPHFYLSPKNITPTTTETRFQRPIQAVYLDGAFYIGAVFDTTLLKQVQPGMRIVSVDGIPAQQMIGSLSAKYRGSAAVQRNKALSGLFYKQEGDSSRVGLLTDNQSDTLTLTFFYKNTCVIPKNFTPEHMLFHQVSPFISYLRINSWMIGNYIRFLNYYPALKNSRALILDLRNNPGGEEAEVIRLASCFIRQPEIFNTPSYPADDDHTLKETLVIYPNKQRNLSHLHLIFLVNERTACASEIFIRFIKTRANGLVIGSSKTSGTYAYAYQVSFPSGLKLTLNATCTPYPTDNRIIERSGIEPDIWVYLKEVKDFAPYNDKLLKTAIRVAEGYQTNPARALTP
jgi:C-terminal processing protease CtpA/Prc